MGFLLYTMASSEQDDLFGGDEPPPPPKLIRCDAVPVDGRPLTEEELKKKIEEFKKNNPDFFKKKLELN